MNTNFNVSRKQFALFLIIAIFALPFLSSCSVTTANLSDVKICTTLSGSDCTSDGSSFPSTSSVIYCSAKLNHAPEGTKVSFTWSHNGESLGTANVETSSANVYSNWNLPGTVEPGKYSVTVKIEADNTKPVTKEFTIE